MKEKRIIGIDFDDVIFDLNIHLMDFFNKRFNTAFKRSDVTNYHMGVLWNLDADQEEDIIREFCQSELHHGILPVKGALEAIEELSKDNTLIIVTARQEIHRDATHKWIDAHLPNIFHSVIFTNYHHIDVGKRINKSKICQEYGIETFIDDSMKNALDVSPVVKKVFLLDTPWNQGDLPENVLRVFSWDEIMEAID